MLGELEASAAERVGSEPLLSLLLLASLAPVDRGEIEHAPGRPAWQQAEQVAQVGPGLDAVHAAAGRMHRP